MLPVSSRRKFHLLRLEERGPQTNSSGSINQVTSYSKLYYPALRMEPKAQALWSQPPALMAVVLSWLTWLPGAAFFSCGTLHTCSSLRAVTLLLPHPRQLFAHLASPCWMLDREASLLPRCICMMTPPCLPCHSYSLFFLFTAHIPL